MTKWTPTPVIARRFSFVLWQRSKGDTLAWWGFGKEFHCRTFRFFDDGNVDMLCITNNSPTPCVSRGVRQDTLSKSSGHGNILVATESQTMSFNFPHIPPSTLWRMLSSPELKLPSDDPVPRYLDNSDGGLWLDIHRAESHNSTGPCSTLSCKLGTPANQSLLAMQPLQCLNPNEWLVPMLRAN